MTTPALVPTQQRTAERFETVLAQARLVIVRLLGGKSYWPYGVEQIAETCAATGATLVLLPGDDQPDPELAAHSTADTEAYRRLWSYLLHGGAANARSFLAYAAMLIGRRFDWLEPAELGEGPPKFIPSSLYCYMVGRNLTRYDRPSCICPQDASTTVDSRSAIPASPFGHARTPRRLPTLPYGANVAAFAPAVSTGIRAPKHRQGAQFRMVRQGEEIPTADRHRPRAV